MISKFSAELYFRADCQLAEGPVWDEGSLYWVDIPAQAIYVKPDQAARPERYALPVEAGALALRENGRLVLATSKGFQEFDLKTGQLLALANPEPENTSNRFNDGKCDPIGRFIAGTLNRERKPLAALYSLEEGKPVRKIYGPVTCSNGLAWAADGSTLYYIDTPTSQVRAFHYELSTGNLSRERVVVAIPSSHGRPDGMTIDTDGNLWIALYQGSGVECWNPGTGAQLARIDVPARNVTSCIFGGHSYETLFITTARIKDGPSVTQDSGGSIFQVNIGCRGVPIVHFGKPVAHTRSIT